MQQGRYERKFFLTSLNERELETIIKLHPAIFSEIYYERQVNSLYFDNRFLDLYQDNVQGSQQRIKVRLRWYEDLYQAKKPNLEFKIKDGLLGDKKIIATADFSALGQLPNINQLLANDQDFNHLTSLKLNNLKPVLLVSYWRCYYQSADKKFRITVDRKLTFYQVDGQEIKWQRQIQPRATILELKYDQSADTEADKISSFLPFRMTKSSKYVLGMTQSYPRLKF